MNELVQDVAVVWVHWQNFVETDENLLLHAILRIYERGELFCKVYGLVYRHLSCLFLVLFKKCSESFDNNRASTYLLGFNVKHFVVLGQLGQEVVKRLY